MMQARENQEWEKQRDFAFRNVYVFYVKYILHTCIFPDTIYISVASRYQFYPSRFLTLYESSTARTMKVIKELGYLLPRGF